jgi:hypothetical protein
MKVKSEKMDSLLTSCNHRDKVLIENHGENGGGKG